MVVDGKAIAETLYSTLVDERAAFSGPVTLGILVKNKSPVIASYLKIKERAAARLSVTIVKKELPDDSSTIEAVAAIQELVETTDGVIPQLPMTNIDVDVVRNAIPREKDVDVLSDEAFSAFEKGDWPAVPPVAAALVYILQSSNIPIKGAHVVVVGKGRLVGKPAEVLFTQLGGRVKALMKGDDVATNTRNADIIVLGTGVAGLLKPDMIKEGVAVIDAGTSELGGKVVGDADPNVAEKAALFTPVPGGVGPVAIAEIYKNLFALKRTYG